MVFEPKTAPSNAGGDQIRVMVVDDSAIIRGLIKRILQEDPEVVVVASAHNGEIALRELKRVPVDVVVLDIEMPVMDGLQALPEMIKMDPDLKVVMASTLTAKNAEISMKALELGAADYVPKPENNREITSGSTFREEILMKVKSLGSFRRQKLSRSASPARKFTSEASNKTPTVSKFRQGAETKEPRPKPAAVPVIATPMFLPTGQVILRKPGIMKPDIIAIGSSTGGPQALFTMLESLDKNIGVPVVLTQHMPPTFTKILAQHIERSTGWKCKEGEEGEALASGQLYLAPGGYHMTIVQKGTERMISLNQDPPENFCRPAVDPMLRSLVKIYGARIIAVILTGMGLDGMKGCEQVVAAGGTVVAQDQQTSVVWGMPGAVATTGLCSAVLPLNKIGPHVSEFMKKVVRK